MHNDSERNLSKSRIAKENMKFTKENQPCCTSQKSSSAQLAQHCTRLSPWSTFTSQVICLLSRAQLTTSTQVYKRTLGMMASSIGEQIHVTQVPLHSVSPACSPWQLARQ